MEWDIDVVDGDPMEDFRVTPLRAERQEAGSGSCRVRVQEEYMEVVRCGVLRGAYMEKPWRSSVDIGVEMDVAAVGTHGGRQWDPRLSLKLASMLSRPADAAMWEHLKDIWLPCAKGSCSNSIVFFKSSRNWGMTVTVDTDPTEAETYVFTRFQWRLPEVPKGGVLCGGQGSKDQDPQGHQEGAQEAGAGGRPAGRSQELESHQAAA